MMRVVVGAAETPTPMLAGLVHYAILNPYWNVPPDLAQQNIAPKLLAWRSFQSIRMEVLLDLGASTTNLDPATHHHAAAAADHRANRTPQLPGPRTSTGRR